jgi:hypothetical protein
MDILAVTDLVIAEAGIVTTSPLSLTRRTWFGSMNNFIPLPALASGTYVYVKRNMVALTADEIDCIIAYIVPLNLWYVLPVESFSPCKNLWFYPNGSKKGSRFESFREAWWLLSPERKEASGEQPP